MTPEQRARQIIDTLLQAAGWIVQDRDQFNPFAGRGIALREAYLRTGYADYLLLVDGKALGVIEAKKEGDTLSGVEHQAARYAAGLQPHMRAWLPQQPLPFRYQSTGVETTFTNELDPEPRSRRLFTFHRPETLAAWAQEPQSLRRRMQTQSGPANPLLTRDLWPPQVEAITNLEASLAQDRPRALIQMATGSGKTFTAINAVYRLIKHAGVRRVLFLVDRTNLGRQALKEFQNFSTPDDGRKFTELYNVQRLQSNHIDDVSRVVITTIQRLYAILSGEDIEAESEEGSLYETYEDAAPPPPKTVTYNPQAPVEFFDLIVVDECHRSIYSVWGQVLEYFDAHIIGLTATPSKLTLGFFKQNLVMEYDHLRAVADNINVPGLDYSIRTRITQDGSTVTVEEAGYYIKKMDRRSRQVRFELMDRDLHYAGQQLDRAVQTDSQIRAIIRHVRDHLFTDLFPGRTEVPKTLVFAKDDTHAEKIVEIIREEFGRGNDFCQKITYRVSGQKPEDLITAFRTNYLPRVAVTVDMIATGTDIKAIELLLFMRLVKSRNYYVQMRGRGTRVISQDELRRVSSDATAKEHFILIDAVGILDQDLADNIPTLDRQPSVPLPRLFEVLSHSGYGPFDPDLIATIAGRLSRLQRRLSAADRQAIRTTAGRSLSQIIHACLDALDPDKQIEHARSKVVAVAESGRTYDPDESEIEAAAQELTAQAAYPLQANPALRALLLDLHGRTEITLDQISQDEVIAGGFSDDTAAAARHLITSFHNYIRQHKDEITALEIILDQPYRRRDLTFAAVKELAERLQQPPHQWTTERLWRAYQQLQQDRVRGAGAPRVLSDIIALVRYTARPDDDTLTPYPELVAGRYQEWLAAQEAAGRTFSEAQRWWLDHIAQHIGVNLAIRPEHLDVGRFHDRGGRFAARRDLGPDWLHLLDELNDALVVV